MKLWRKPTLTALCVLGALAGPVSAKTLHVENNGVDGPNCGGKAGACRSISRAIANAADGDRIIVGPGIYGDIDGDNAFTTPGDEMAHIGFGCQCMLRINKPVRVVSAQGASATVIHGGSVPFEALVKISASSATFGEQNKGFFVSTDPFGGFNFEGAGIRTMAATVAVNVGGNVVQNAFVGFDLRGNGHRADFNRALGNERGFVMAGDDMTLENNVAMGNEDGILVTAGHAWLLSNAIIGNRTMGVALLRGQDHRVRYSAVLGNPGGGVQVDSFCPGRTCKDVDGAININDIFGNVGPGTFGSPAPGNCGIINAKKPSLGPLEARDNYWGRAGGTGPDPADQVCNQGGSTANNALQSLMGAQGLDIAPQH